MKGRCATGKGGGVGLADVGGQLPLERIDVGTERGDPVGIEGVQQELALVFAHVRRDKKIRATKRR